MNIVLVYREGSLRGAQIVVKQPDFRIGRLAESDFCINSRMVSRRHCAIITRQNLVAIIDFGSRNPTAVNGKPLLKNKPCLLNSRDKVQIGRLKFRLFIYDEDRCDSTNKHVSPADLLMKELDDLATGFQSHPDSILTPVKAAIPASPPLVDSHANQDDEPSSDPQHQTTISIPASESGEADVDDESADRSESVESKKPEAEFPKGPQKLPNHLRPKAPATSQNAAEVALRNIFNRR
ncbi:MAG: FHA domain-containing protein [Rubripirellula sp.]